MTKRPSYISWSEVTSPTAGQVAPNVRFKKGINEITNKDCETKALPCFRKLLTRLIRDVLIAKKSDDESLEQLDERVKRTVQENIEHHREHGFTKEEIKGFRGDYSTYWPPHAKKK